MKVKKIENILNEIGSYVFIDDINYLLSFTINWNRIMHSDVL